MCGCADKTRTQEAPEPTFSIGDMVTYDPRGKRVVWKVFDIQFRNTSQHGWTWIYCLENTLDENECVRAWGGELAYDDGIPF